MRIDLEKTLALAEALYLQVMAAEEKLPNTIRTIVGLPEVEEPTPDNLEIVEGPSGDQGGRNSALPRPNRTNGNQLKSDMLVNHGATNLSTSPDAVALENQYEIGVSQFM